MIRCGQNLTADQRGVVSVEFAMIGSALLLFTLGTIELGMVFWSIGALQNAAELTARCVAIGGSSCANAQQFAVTTAQATLFNGVITTDEVTVVNGTSCNNAAGSYVKVTITAHRWSNASLLSSLSRTALTSQACYPIST